MGERYVGDAKGGQMCWRGMGDRGTGSGGGGKTLAAAAVRTLAVAGTENTFVVAVKTLAAVKILAAGV